MRLPLPELQMPVTKGKKADLADNLVDFPGVLQGQVVLRRQAVEVRRPLHLVQVFLVFKLRSEISLEVNQTLVAAC